ncbi:uncharacterized protein [Cicer arietinum]|uniref:uncharacterized protein n=1 Tax=Cicer arietinum TaxID=3827 RepID=UPI003CC65DB0
MLLRLTKLGNNAKYQEQQLLERHKPSSERYISKINVHISPTKSNFEIGKLRCPKGTAPIRTVTKDDLIGGIYLFNDHILAQTNFYRHSTHASLIKLCASYFGVSGTNNVYNLKVFKGQGNSINRSLMASNQVGLDGLPITLVNAPGPSMGSGHFLGENFSHTAYFRNVAFHNVSRQFYGLLEYLIEKINDASKKCYQILFHEEYPRPIGCALQFGGPGGDCEK